MKGFLLLKEVKILTQRFLVLTRSLNFCQVSQFCREDDGVTFSDLPCVLWSLFGVPVSGKSVDLLVRQNA